MITTTEDSAPSLLELGDVVRAVESGGEDIIQFSSGHNSGSHPCSAKC